MNRGPLGPAKQRASRGGYGKPTIRSVTHRHFANVLVTLAIVLCAPSARAQACCAGASAITPGRLELHEKALIGSQLRVAGSLGTFNSQGRFRSNPPGASEVDFEQDLFASVRWLRRGQLSLLFPLLLSRRSSETTGTELGGGIGDLNLGLRYDLVRNRELSYLPGIGLLGGATFPTGRAPEDAKQPLASDATGTGATQLGLGLALERSFARWLLSATALLSKRFSREVNGVESELAPQLSAVIGASYTVSDEFAVALFTTYNYEADASIDGQRVSGTGRRQLRLSLACSAELDAFRLHGNAFLDPPVDGAGQNQTASVGAVIGVVWSFL